MAFNRISADRLRNAACLLSCIFIMFLSQVVAFADSTTGGDSGNTNIAETVVGPDIPATDSFYPDLFTGTASYRIPITVPAGRKGLTPRLALSYRGSNGNGFVGVGWELEAGSIERNSKGGVNVSGNDYVLRGPGGATELVNIPGTSEYHAKIEGNFIRIIKQGNWWEATDKNGVSYRYGFDNSTRQYDPAPYRPDNIFKWCIDRITDTNNNYITYSYTTDNKQIYLNRIDYNGNDVVSPNIATNIYLKFNYEGRNDLLTTYYTTGFYFYTDKRLVGIEVWANSALVKKYILTYDAHSTDPAHYSPLTKRSILGAVTEYGSDGTTSKPPITFSYSNNYTIDNGSPTGGFKSEYWTGPNPGLPIANKCLTGDFNGNGYRDIACYSGSGSTWDMFFSTGTGWQTASWTNGIGNISPFWQHCMTGDFKGDGKTSVVCNSGGATWTMMHSSADGNGWETETWSNGPQHPAI